MKTSLPPESVEEILARLRKSNAAFARRYPGESDLRQPVHTVYGGAHLFQTGTAKKLGALALNALEQFAPDCLMFAKAIGLPGAEQLPDSLEQNPDLKARLSADPEALRTENRPAWLAHII